MPEKKEKQRDYSLHIVAAVALVAVFLLFAQQKAAPTLSALPAADFSADMAEIGEVTGNPVAGTRQNGDQCSSNTDCASRQCDWGLLLYRTSRPDTRSCASPRDCGGGTARCEVVQGIGRACQQKYCVAPRPQPNGARCARDQDCTSGWCQQRGVNYVCTQGNACSRDYDRCQGGRACRWELSGGRNTPNEQRNFNRNSALGCYWPLQEGHPCERTSDCKQQDNLACVNGRCRSAAQQQARQQAQPAQQQAQRAPASQGIQGFACTASNNPQFRKALIVAGQQNSVSISLLTQQARNSWHTSGTVTTHGRGAAAYQTVDNIDLRRYGVRSSCQILSYPPERNSIMPLSCGRGSTMYTFSSCAPCSGDACTRHLQS